MSCPADEPIYVIKYFREYGRYRTKLATYIKENSFKQNSRAGEKKERKLLTLLYILLLGVCFSFGATRPTHGYRNIQVKRQTMTSGSLTVIG